MPSIRNELAAVLLLASATDGYFNNPDGERLPFT
jgi:hypothetical protein